MELEYREAPDGRGAFKVNYITPDKMNIGNDRFYTKHEAQLFARELESKGYEVSLSND